MTDDAAPAGNAATSPSVYRHMITTSPLDRTFRRTVVAGAAAVAALLGAVSVSELRSSAEQSSPTTTTDPPVTAGLADGRHFGRLDAAYVAPAEAVFDAMRLDPEGPVDVGPGPLSLPVAPDVAVTLVDCADGCVEGAPGDYGALTRSLDGTSWFRVTVERGTITRIDQAYVP